MESLKIADQKTMEEFFKTNLNLFPQAKELLSLQIFRHDPSMIINPTVVIAKYQLRLLLKNGQTTTLILRGSADTVGYKRLKSYHILQALWGSGFGEGINIVPRPLGYFSDLRLLLYENVNGRSLIDAFKHPAEIYLKKAVEIETLKAQAEVQLLDQMAGQLSVIKVGDKRTLPAYLRNVRLALLSKAKRIILENKR